MPWPAWRACLSNPRIKSLSYDAGLYDLAIQPFPLDEVEAAAVSLKKFSYTTTMWREWTNGVAVVRGALRPISMRPLFAFEQQCLSAIVLKMSHSATSLTLPMESAPLLPMAELAWPYLQELNLRGRFLCSDQVSYLKLLLPSMPSLRKLSILAARSSKVGRPAFFPQTSPYPSRHNTQRRRSSSSRSSSSSDSSSSSSSSDSEPSLSLSDLERDPGPGSPDLLIQLRSLEIAFPDPEDGIFSFTMPNLTRLSLEINHAYTTS
ncbi:hypothetical protein LXA43DRAFT_317011 [Ganoderma leucocontextum]|nr:hypothetical protein LXA43DRAFT_317011 [Ganoderma leucocontextum]